MKKSELLNLVANGTGIQRSTCESVMNAIIEEITQALIRGEKVSIQDFMTFELGRRAERRARNPATGDIVMFPEVKTVKCKMSKSVKDVLNNK